MSKKIFLSPERRPKPHGKYIVGDYYEHDICNKIGELLKKELEANGFIVMLITNPWLLLSQRVELANRGMYDYYMAIHTNGGGGTGAECLHDDTENSRRANRLVYSELVKIYPSSRGIKDYSHFYENSMTNMVCCYPEIAFHDNLKDAEFIINSTAEIAKALCKGVCAYFNAEYKEDRLYKVQTGAFKDIENAKELSQKLKRSGYETYIT